MLKDKRIWRGSLAELDGLVEEWYLASLHGPTCRHGSPSWPPPWVNKPAAQFESVSGLMRAALAVSV